MIASGRLGSFGPITCIILLLLLGILNEIFYETILIDVFFDSEGKPEI
jgi:hypothetical protein